MSRPYIVNAHPVAALLTDAHAVYSNWHSIFGIWSYVRTHHVSMQSRMAYPAAISIPLLCSKQWTTTDGGVHRCTTIWRVYEAHTNSTLNASSALYFYKCDNSIKTFNCLMLSYHVPQCGGIYRHRPLPPKPPAHTHIHKVDIQDCHQASDNCHWPYMNRCTRFRWWKPCQQQEPWEMRQTPSYVGAYKLIVLSVQASRIFSGCGLCKKCFTPRHGVMREVHWESLGTRWY